MSNLIRVGAVGASGVGKTTYFLSVLGEPREPSPTLFLDLYPPFPLFDVFNENNKIKIKGEFKFIQIYDPAGDPILKEYSFKILQNYIPNFDVLLSVIDGERIDESIKYLNKWKKYFNDKQLKSVIITKLGKENCQIKEKDLLSENTYLDKCLQYYNDIGASYLSLVESLNNPREFIVMINKQSIKPVKLKKIGGAIVVPLIKKAFSVNYKWIDKATRQPYKERGLL